MKITKITSHVLSYDLDEELGYSQQYYAKRTAHRLYGELRAAFDGAVAPFGGRV